MPDPIKQSISPHIMRAMEARRPGFAERLQSSFDQFGENTVKGYKTGSAFVQNIEIPEYQPPGNQQGAHEDVNQRGVDDIARLSDAAPSSELEEELESLQDLLDELAADVAALKELLYGEDGEPGGDDGGLAERLANACVDWQCESDGTLSITLRTDGHECTSG
ncbi:hypothetical protein [Cerasicoccus frondis]|uniref:hypothetical protein n=1 Tax=Cerasicoccus frondis TaxID=490090 RepID=UPI002852AFC0|nr:hypothetical protein [Cerasicoccus frondis]